MSPLFNKIITSLVLASFVMIILFGFVTMMHSQDGNMSGDCPFSSTGVSLCPTDTVAMAVYHISAYYSFLDVTINSGLALHLVSLFLVAIALLVFYISSFSQIIFSSARSILGSPPDASRDRKITRWLSLFENSPSLV